MSFFLHTIKVSGVQCCLDNTGHKISFKEVSYFLIELTFLIHLSMKVFFFSLYDFFIFLKEVCYAHQCCLYLIKNKVKRVIL